jgi:hypothetical protein
MEITIENAAELLAELAESMPAHPEVVPGAYTVKQKALKAIFKKGLLSPLAVRKGFVAYSASEPFYIRAIRFYGPDVDKIIKSLAVRTVKSSGVKSTARKLLKVSNGAYAYTGVDDLISSFELESVSKRVGVEISRIEVTGYTVGQLEEGAETTRKLIQLRFDLDSFREDFIEAIEAAKAANLVAAEIRDEIDLEVQELTSSKEKLDADLIKLKSDVEVAKSLFDSETSRLDGAVNSKKQLDAELSVLNEKLAGVRVELNDLIQQKRLISDEYSDFVLEGRGQAKIYGELSILPLFGALIILWFLLRAGWDFAGIIVSTPQEAFSHLIQRAPYTMATIIAFTLLIKVAHMLLDKVISIHGERLALAKLLVIARDTVHTSSRGLDISDDEVFQERVKLKMELLRQHLKLAEIDSVISVSENMSNKGGGSSSAVTNDEKQSAPAPLLS